jgi:hypothetical protein
LTFKSDHGESVLAIRYKLVWTLKVRANLAMDESVCRLWSLRHLWAIVWYRELLERSDADQRECTARLDPLHGLLFERNL